MYYTSEVKRDVEKIKYDTINTVIKRKKDGSIYIERCDFIGPELFVKISGGANCPNSFAKIKDYPLNIDVNIGLSGKLGYDMDKIGFVKYNLTNQNICKDQDFP